MAKTRSIQNSFLSGELSPLLTGNTGINQYYQGLQQAKNVVIVPQGGVKRRAGTEFLTANKPILERVPAITAAMPNGGDPAIINDNDASTTTVTTTGATTNDYVIASYDLGAAYEIEFVDLVGVKRIGSDPLAISVQFSDDNVSWSFQGNSIFSYMDTDQKTFRLQPDGSAHRYWRVAVDISIINFNVFSGQTFSLSGFNLYRAIGTSPAKILNFDTVSSYQYILVLTGSNILTIRKYINNGTTFYQTLSNVPSPFFTSEIKDVRHAISGNVCLLFHENHPTVRLLVEDGFNFNPIQPDSAPYANIPKFDFNDDLSPVPVSEVQDITFGAFTLGMKYQVDVDGVLSKSITFAGDANPDQQAATEFNLQKNLQDMPNFGTTGISVNRQGNNLYRITIGGESADEFRLFSGFNTTGGAATLTFTKITTGAPRKEPVWSATRGYPRMGAFFGGRLWIGGTRDKKQSLFGSKSGDFLNFEIGEGDDDEAIFQTITSRNLTEITDIYPGRNLLIFTAGGEYADLGDVVTPATINIRSQTSNGSLYIQSSEADGAVVYCDKNGKTLREAVYSFNENAYTSNDISVLSSHLIRKPTETSYLTGTASDDANWLFILNSDGNISILNKLRSQDINGFTSMEMATPYTEKTVIESVQVVDNDVFFSVTRYDSNDVPVSTIERWDFDRMLDGSFQFDSGDINLNAVENAYLTPFIGYEVSVIGDGAVLDKRTVTTAASGRGSITLTDSEINNHTSFEVGFNFVPIVQQMPVNTNIGSGDNFMRLKKIVRLNLRVLNTFGLYVDDEPVAHRVFGTSTIGDPPTPYSGILDDLYPAEGWSRDAMPVFSCPDPTPMHIQAIDMEVESS